MAEWEHLELIGFSSGSISWGNNQAPELSMAGMDGMGCNDVHSDFMWGGMAGQVDDDPCQMDM